MKSILLALGDIRDIVQFTGPDRFMDEVIDGIQTALQDSDQGRFEVPVRDGFEYSVPQTGLLEWMPAMEIGRSATFKVVGYHPQNPAQQQLPTILSVAMTFDTSNGHLIGLVDGTFPTAVRTGAASAIASRLLASPESRILGLVGAGAQAVTQLHALSRVFDFDEVLVYDIDAETNENFLRRIKPLQLAKRTRVRVATLAEVVGNADILCTATSVEIGGGPIFDDLTLKPWVHINAVGSDFPGKIELPLEVLRTSLVCPDCRAQAIREGECQQLEPQMIGPDLLTLVRDEALAAPYRDRATVFDSTGWALEDHVIVKQLIGYAERMGLGTPVQIEGISDDPKDPYGFLGEGRLLLKEEGDDARTAHSL